jgi:hypothetical protein
LYLLDAALLTQSKIFKMAPVSRSNLSFLKDWMERPLMGGFPLLGADRKSWNEDFEVDLVCLKNPPATDPFSVWFINSFLPRVHQKFGERFKVGGFVTDEAILAADVC